MSNLKLAAKRLSLAFIIGVQLICYPAVGYAQTTDQSSDSADSTPTSSATTSETQDSTPSTTSTDTTTTSEAETPATTTPAPEQQPVQSTGPQTPTGPTSPTGPDGQTYRYNPDTGVWENAQYTWNPTTQQYAPKSSPTTVYDTNSGTWQTTQWRFDAPSGTYVPNVSVSGRPSASRLLSGAQGTGPQSNNSISDVNNSNGQFNSSTTAQILNGITQGAYSGNVLLGQNTVAGNGQSGDANDMANIINMLQSSWSPSSGEFNTYSADLYGDITGDLYVDPAALAAGPGSNLSVNKETNANVDVNVANDGSIINNVNLTAKSGNVDVTNNSQAGDATSGAAHAVANIVNAINSSIASGQSFIGNINIYGNLDGDILLPPNILQQLIASSGPQATVNESNVENINVLADLTDVQNITNNTDLNAASGQVNSSANTKSGNATSGDANTNLTVLNLTGREVIGSDALLVFVNVLGKWVGVIMNAPAGSTAAALGDTTVNSTTNLNAQLTENNRGQITNNVNINATSGDVNATGNTSVGNAKSGNATASLNLVNINRSQLNLSNWLGVLFINVFGSWNGSFGVNTAAGNPITTSVATANAPVATQAKVFRFVPTADNKFQLAQVTTDTSPAATPPVQSSQSPSNVLDAAVKKPASITTRSSQNWTLPIIGLFSGAALLGIERALAFRQRRSA